MCDMLGSMALTSAGEVIKVIDIHADIELWALLKALNARKTFFSVYSV